MRNIGKFAFLALFVLAAAALMVSCGKSGSLNPNQAPTVKITSYTGDSLAAGEFPDSLATDDPVLFQQKIYWSGTDADGWITGYAYRIMDADGVYLATPGNMHISPEGWVYHYKPGADETIPLEGDPQSPDVRTIWTTSPYAVINFPAADENGAAMNVPSIFQVKCKDNRETESEITGRYFVAESVAPHVTIYNDKGDPTDRVVGSGVRFEFGMIDDDPYVVTEPWKFRYRVLKLNGDGAVIDDTVEWYWLEDFGRKARVLLTGETEPPLLSDYPEGSDEPTTKTRLEVVVYDQAGIASEPNTMDFWVTNDYTPETIIYDYDIYALGANHFTTYQDVSLEIVIPTQQTAEGTIYSTPLFKDKDENYVAVWSSDLRVFMSWGYHGEYLEDNPRNQKKDFVLDQETNINYLSEIQYFDVRLDDAPFYYPPFVGHPEYYVTDQDSLGNDRTWLRIPINADIAHEAVINNTRWTNPDDPNDVIRLEVRAVDLQGVADPTPAVYTFKLDRPVPPDEKEGILIIDDDPVHPSFAPEPELFNFYNSLFEGSAYQPVDVLNRSELAATVWDSNLHYGMDVFSPTDLQRYKCIIWHSDNPSASEKHNFFKEYDVMNICLRLGSNIIVTGGANLVDTFNGCKNNGFPLLDRYFGISTLSGNDEPSMTFIEGNVIANPWFTHSVAQEAGYTDINVNLDGLVPSLGTLLTPRGGMGAVGCFNPDYMAYNVRKLYRTGLKPVGEGTYDPSQEEYDMYNNKINFIAYERPVISYPGSTQINALVAFPPSYMVQSEMRANIQRLVDEIMAQ